MLVMHQRNCHHASRATEGVGEPLVDGSGIDTGEGVWIEVSSEPRGSD